MTTLEIRNIVAALFSLGFAATCLSYVLTNQRRKAKKPLYFAAAMLFIISASAYILATLIQHGNYPFPDWMIYWVRSGWLTVVNLVLIGGALSANVLADWRKG